MLASNRERPTFPFISHAQSAGDMPLSINWEWIAALTISLKLNTAGNTSKERVNYAATALTIVSSDFIWICQSLFFSVLQTLPLVYQWIYDECQNSRIQCKVTQYCTSHRGMCQCGFFLNSLIFLTRVKLSMCETALWALWSLNTNTLYLLAKQMIQWQQVYGVSVCIGENGHMAQRQGMMC